MVMKFAQGEINVNKILKHLNQHGEKLYQCSLCLLITSHEDEVLNHYNEQHFLDSITYVEYIREYDKVEIRYANTKILVCHEGRV